MANVVRLAMNFALRDDYAEPLQPPANLNAALTFHARAVPSHDPPDATDRLALIGAVYQWWADDHELANGLQKRYYANVILNSISAQTVEPTPSDVDFYSVSEDGIFTGDEGPQFPPNVAFLVGLRTGTDTRRYRGRMYFLPFAQTDSWLDPGGAYNDFDPDPREELGRICAALADRIALIDSVPTQQWALAVYSRVDGDAHPVTHFVVPNRCATQRRRLAAVTDYLTVGISGEPE